MRGVFITLEGPEGSGKSTHSNLLVAYLRKRGYSVLHTREPGGTPFGEKIRKVLLSPGNEISPLSEMLLYQACRYELINKVILPALKKGKLVICDRFLDATIAYQGYGGGLSVDFIRCVGRHATVSLKPKLTILLDVPTQLGLKRAGRKDRLEQKPIAYHHKVRRGYLELARKEPRRIKIISGTGGLSDIQDRIRKAVLDVIG